MNVLGLFDGKSGGQIALDRLNIKVENYFASEIDKFAIATTKKNFPNTKHIGNVLEVKGSDLPKIHVLLGGTPCQNLSISVINNIKHNKGLEGEKSKLFYEYVRIKEETNPTFFLLENVGSMSDKDKDIISEALGVEPICIDSNLVSAQDRKRYYWTNIPFNEQIVDKGIILADIVLPSTEVPEKYWYTQDFTYHGDDAKVQATLHVNGHDILKRVYNLNGKCGTLTCVRGGNHQKKVFQDGRCRKLTPLEYERLQTMNDNHTEGVSDTQRYNMCGNGWTIDVIVLLLKGLTEYYPSNAPIN